MTEKKGEGRDLAKNYLTVFISDVHQHKKMKEAFCSCRILGATIISGRGAVPSMILNLLGLDSTRKELILMVTPEEEMKALHESFCEKMQLSKKGHGISFSLPLNYTLGVNYLVGKEAVDEEGEDFMYELAVIIVDRNKGEDIIQAAREAGAKGATILHGRGSGAHREERFFNLDIEPEKEVVLFVLEKTKTKAVLESLKKVVDFSKPNSGIFFTAPLNAVNGLLEQVQNK